MTRAPKSLLAGLTGFAFGVGLAAFQGWEKPWTGAGNLLTLLGSGISGALVALVGVLILSRANRGSGD